MAVDREAITDKVLKTGEIPAYSFVPPGTSNYGEPSEPSWRDTPYAQRLMEAGQLLRQAGYGPDRPLRLTIRYNTSGTYKRVAVAIQDMWKRIGVQASLENAEVKVHYNMLEQGDFDIGRAGMSADYNDAQNFLFVLQSSSGVQNFGRYSNPAFDAIMQQAARTTDPLHPLRPTPPSGKAGARGRGGYPHHVLHLEEFNTIQCPWLAAEHPKRSSSAIHLACPLNGLLEEAGPLAGRFVSPSER